MNGMPSGSSNWKLIGGLVLLVGVGILLAVAGSGSGSKLLSFAPFLFILACPLMMIFMMGSMGHHHSPESNEYTSGVADDPMDLAGLSRDQKERVLRHELTRLAWRQEALRQALDQIEAEQKARRPSGMQHTVGSR
jgi:hypothetical protein